MLSLAGGTSPDIYFCWFHIMCHDIEQGFIYPLNEWIGEDLNGDGQISDSEAKWPGWKDVPPLWRQVATKNGKVYGVPMAGTWYYGIIYRKDLVQQAGLDPEKMPETWDEFYKWCQQLTFPRRQVSGAKVQRGQRAFGLECRPSVRVPQLGGEFPPQANRGLRQSVAKVGEEIDIGIVLHPVDVSQFPQARNVHVIDVECLVQRLAQARLAG
jgi:ABC-type glycerol-3-phosphate transport system substrate-binding protein